MLTAALAAAGCGEVGDGPMASGGAGGVIATGGSGTAVGGGGAGGTGPTGGGGGTDLGLGCKGPVPPGAPEAAAPKPYSGGSCPPLPPASAADVAIVSSGSARTFYLVVPADLDPSERLPLLFLWHWLGGSAKSFLEKGEVQAAADQQRFLAVIPQKKGDLQFAWPFSALDSAARMQEEAIFFDDLLACVSEQFPVEPSCVASAGVSAGALWTDQLVGLRGEYLASFMSLSGGTGGAAIKPFTAPAHKLPGFVLWGGPDDNCYGVLSFAALSQDLEDNLVAGGHFFLECIHNCGHAVPPFEAAPGSSTFRSLWQFALDHPFWLAPGESPYASGLPADLPSWCGIGKGSAVPRTGACSEPSAC
jgi:predicted esterase